MQLCHRVPNHSLVKASVDKEAGALRCWRKMGEHLTSGTKQQICILHDEKMAKLQKVDYLGWVGLVFGLNGNSDSLREYVQIGRV